jgi:hypothetical protein
VKGERQQSSAILDDNSSGTTATPVHGDDGSPSPARSPLHKVTALEKQKTVSLQEQKTMSLQEWREKNGHEARSVTALERQKTAEKNGLDARLLQSPRIVDPFAAAGSNDMNSKGSVYYKQERPRALQHQRTVDTAEVRRTSGENSSPLTTPSSSRRGSAQRVKTSELPILPQPPENATRRVVTQPLPDMSHLSDQCPPVPDTRHRTVAAAGSDAVADSTSTRPSPRRRTETALSHQRMMPLDLSPDAPSRNRQVAPSSPMRSPAAGRNTAGTSTSVILGGRGGMAVFGVPGSG